MPRQTMQEVHESGRHAREPRNRCPLCKAGVRAHGLYPFVHVMWKTPNGGVRSSWAEELKRGYPELSPYRWFALRDRFGEETNPPELLCCDPKDIVDVSEAHQNLKYGTLQCVELSK